MGKHVETKSEGRSAFGFGPKVYSGHVCGGDGKDAVKAYGSTRSEARERALDKYAGKE